MNGHERTIARVALQAAIAAKEAGRLDEAEQLLRAAISEGASNALLWSQLGYVQREMQHTEDAIASFRAAIRLQPTLAQAHSGLGWVFFELDALDEAGRAFEASLALEPAAHHFGALATVRFHQGRIDESEQLFRQALERDPQYDEALFMLAMILRLYRDMPAQAVTLLRKAISIDPDYALAHRELGAVRWPSRNPQGKTDLALGRLFKRVESELLSTEGKSRPSPVPPAGRR